jgi:hypothetical protein
MRTSFFAAAAAAALLTSGAALAQNGSQANVPSSEHMNSAHANAPSTPAGVPDQQNRGGMNDTSLDRTRSDADDQGMRAEDRMRVNETGRANIRLTTLQRTRIKEVVLRGRAPRLTRVDFRLGVGARVPHTVRVAVLPPEIVAVAPQWAGFSYFVYGNEIVVVDPASFAVVGVLPL